MNSEIKDGRLRRRFAQRGYAVFRCRDTYPEEKTVHHHDFYEVNLFYGGAMEYIVESRAYQITPGDLLLVSPNELHQSVAGTVPAGLERVVLWIDKAYLQRFSTLGFDIAACFDTSRPNHSNCLRFDDDQTMRIFGLLEACIREDASEEFGAQMLADTAMIQVMIQINRLALRGDARSVPPDRSGTLVAQVVDYINTHYAEELSLDGLANMFFISKYHLSREFSRLVGTTVHRYIIQKRLAVAKQLLSEGKTSSAVYQQCGFGDYSNFYRAFRSEYGISPKEYVALVRQDAAINAERSREQRWLLGDPEPTSQEK